MAPAARIASALASTWFAVGNTVYVGSNHAETQSSAMTITSVTSGSVIGKIICHNNVGSYPPTGGDIRTTATVTTTGSSAITINPSGGLYIYGITFSAGTGTGQGLTLTASNGWYYLDNCVLKIPGTLANSISVGGGNSNVIIFNNVQVSFGNVASNLYFDSNTTFVWQSTGTVLASGSLVPTSLLALTTSARKHDIVLEALDLSQISGNLWNDGGTNASVSTIVVRDCKLHATTATPTPANYGKFVQFARSSS